MKDKRSWEFIGRCGLSLSLMAITFTVLGTHNVNDLVSWWIEYIAAIGLVLYICAGIWGGEDVEDSKT